MACTDAIIVQQIENYLTNDNLPELTNFARTNDGWIRIELLNNCKSLSIYNYEQILRALCSKSSDIIELSLFEPRCVRRRYHRSQPLTEESIQDTRTVIVTGLPMDLSTDQLSDFFRGFYPVEGLKRIPSFSQRFPGKIHVMFKTSSDALAFVEQSKRIPIKYIDYPSSHAYPIVCQMLNNPPTIPKAKPFSTRLANLSAPSKVCLNSNTCATEQILFCQNLPPTKSMKTTQEKLVRNKYSYEFYIPDDHLQQTHSCVMISVLNPFCFTVQLQEDAVEFDKFQREINEFYNTNKGKEYFLTPEQIQKHLCVLCLDPKSTDEKKIWNRSQILDYDPVDNTVNLFYVDLGTWDEYVPIDRLRYLTERFHHQMVLSITCRLTRIHPINDDNDLCTWTDDATNQFLAVIEHNIPQIKFLTVDSNGCFNTELFVNNADQHICVNDYLVHIKRAKFIDLINQLDDDQGGTPPIHPVVALYNRFGEILQQSLEGSRSGSISNSSISSPTSSIRSTVKIKHINIETNSIQNSEQQIIPMIFVQYEKSILIPDFNIVTILQSINPGFSLHMIEHYAFRIRYNSIPITPETNFDMFTQLNSFIDVPYSNSIALYPLDFVEYILKHYNLRVANVFLALENAKQAQSHSSDLALWFAIDNDVKSMVSSVSSPSSIPYRLSFSNRSIN